MMLDWFETNFFENAGSRIKRVALWLFAIEFVISAISAIIVFFVLLFNMSDFGPACMLAPIGFFVAVGVEWLATLPLYGFGELLECSFDIEKNTRTKKPFVSTTEQGRVETYEPMTPRKDRASTLTKESDENWKCPKCDTLNSASCNICQRCREPRYSKSVPEAEHLIYCTACGVKNKAGNKNCWSCDAPLR